MYARHTDPDTSHIAMRDPSAMEAEVLKVIRRYKNGCIAEQLEQALPHIRINSITPRPAALIRKGLVIDTGERRQTSNGSWQRVLVAL